MRFASGICITVASILFASVALPAATQPATSPATSRDSFEYKSPTGVAFVVTAEGLSSIRVGDRELAKGSWRASNAEGWFKHGSGKVAADKITAKSLEVLDAAHARVRHVQEDITAVYDYRFDSEDVTISARLENANETEPMEVVQFSGLSFVFDRKPLGVMNSQHVTYFQAHGVAKCHPGEWSPIGGSYAVDSSAGVGLSPWRTGLTRTLILWYYTDWKKQDQSLDRQLKYFVVSPVPPRGAAAFDFRMRVSTNTDWKHLLAPYKEHFAATFGPVQYHSDNCWIATMYANRNREAIAPQNPYGFHPGANRLDLPEGIKALCDRQLAGFASGGGQGLILWGQGGEEVRGGMYRPDFDILPPEVATQWATLDRRFREVGARLGVTTRPRHMAVRQNWTSDEIIDINPDDPGHRKMLWERFKNMIDKGCTLFYLDSFGDSFEDVKLMQFLRKQMGPEIQTFCEHQCDAIFPYTGGYSESTFQGDDEGKGGHYILWSGVDRWQIYRWLCPGAQMASRLFQVKGKMPKDGESFEHFCYTNKISPLRPEGQSAVPLAELKKLQDQFVDGNGQWRDEPGTPPAKLSPATMPASAPASAATGSALTK